jgi:hypothetical protein
MVRESPKLSSIRQYEPTGTFAHFAITFERGDWLAP